MKKKLEITWESESDNYRFDTFVEAENWRTAFNDLFKLFNSWYKYGEEKSVSKKVVLEWFDEALNKNGFDFLDVG